MLHRPQNDDLLCGVTLIYLLIFNS